MGFCALNVIISFNMLPIFFFITLDNDLANMTLHREHDKKIQCKMCQRILG